MKFLPALKSIAWIAATAIMLAIAVTAPAHAHWRLSLITRPAISPQSSTAFLQPRLNGHRQDAPIAGALAIRRAVTASILDVGRLTADLNNYRDDSRRQSALRRGFDLIKDLKPEFSVPYFWNQHFHNELRDRWRYQENSRLASEPLFLTF